MEKGQITVYMIIALVVIIFLGIFLVYITYHQSEQINSNTEELYNTESSFDTINEYIEDCLDQKTIEIAFNYFGLQGGDNTPFGSYITDGSQKIPYWYIQGEDISPSLEELQKRFSNQIEQEAKECFVFDFFRNTKIIAETDKSKVNVTINNNSITIEYYYPIKATIGKSQKNFESFSSSVPVPLGRNYQLSRKILNKAINLSSYYLKNDCKELQNSFDVKIFTLNNQIIIKDYSTYYDKKIDRTFEFRYAYENLTIYGFCD